MIDTEWTFAYRGQCLARADPAELPGFDQELWARASNADERPMAELLADDGQQRSREDLPSCPDWVHADS